ncbi:MAG: hypothetical protein ACP5E5_06250 [Acidobacteriaceae bacterium]
MKALGVAAIALVALCLPPALRADGARFDLVGPKIQVQVTRNGLTLPIAQVPDLQPGDRLWVKADLPRTQSNHFLLVVAFLRGATNEPPDNWFTPIDTWSRKTDEGTTVIVPQGAQQALLFIAPKTGGDFKTLRSAVRGNPGTFIRADADLNEASFEEERIQHYLQAMQSVADADAKTIQQRSAKLAATLALQPNAACFSQPVDQQVTCLTQSRAPVILNDGHGQGIAEALSGGPSSDFINTASTTQAAGGGYYSAYVGTVVDLIALVGSLHTAQYQYIPGLSFPQADTLNLKLNKPPSFHNPMSVIVVGLPAIQSVKPPHLRPPDLEEVVCLAHPRMVLPLVGAPLVFSTGFAHDLVLHLNRTGTNTDLPIVPDAAAGGLVVAQDDGRRRLNPNRPWPLAPDAAAGPPAPASSLLLSGTVRGYWGFTPFQGPTLTFQQTAGKDWKILGDTQLLAGLSTHLTLSAQGTGCVQQIHLTNASGAVGHVAFQPQSGLQRSAQARLDLNLSLKDVSPGSYSLAIQQYGEPQPVILPLTVYTNDITLSELRIHTGDYVATLTGQGLQNVASVEVDHQTFTPVIPSANSTTADAAGPPGTLQLQAQSAVSPSFGSQAIVRLKDGRTRNVPIQVLAARPSLQLVYVHAKPAQPRAGLSITLSDAAAIPLDGTLTFVVQTRTNFPRTEKIQVATADGALSTELSLRDNSLVLQDEHTAVATLNLLHAFGRSAFGELRIRAVAADGADGAWITLGTLVRRPHITAIHCTTLADPTCTLQGDDLFLAQSFSAAGDFTHPTDVPIGFTDSTFNVPTPSDGKTLYLKLRDDPTEIATLTLSTPIPKPAPPPPAALPAPSQLQPSTAVLTPQPSNLNPSSASVSASQPSTSTANPSRAAQPAPSQPATSGTALQSATIKPSRTQTLPPTTGATQATPVSMPVSRPAPRATPATPSVAPSNAQPQPLSATPQTQAAAPTTAAPQTTPPPTQ